MSSSLLATLRHPIDSLIAGPSDALAAAMFHPSAVDVVGVAAVLSCFWLVLWGAMADAAPRARRRLNVVMLTLVVAVGVPSGVSARRHLRTEAVASATTLRMLLNAPPSWNVIVSRAPEGKLRIGGTAPTPPDSALGREIRPAGIDLVYVEIKNSDVPAVERALGIRTADAGALRGLRLAARP